MLQSQGNRNQEAATHSTTGINALGTDLGDRGLPSLFHPVRGEMRGMIVILFFTAATMGLAWGMSDRVQSAPVVQTDEEINAGIAIREEIIHLWLPESLAKLVNSSSRAVVHSDPNELWAFLQQPSLQQLKYAVTVRNHLADGRHCDVIFICRLAEAPYYYEEFLASIDTKTKRGKSFDFSGISVHRISDQLLSRDMAIIMRELQNIHGELIAD